MDTLPYLITSCTGIPTAETDSLLNSTTTSHHLQCNMGRKAIISSTVSHYLPKDSCKMRDFSRKKKHTHTNETSISTKKYQNTNINDIDHNSDNYPDNDDNKVPR